LHRNGQCHIVISDSYSQTFYALQGTDQGLLTPERFA